MENDFKEFVFNSINYLNNVEYEKFFKKQYVMDLEEFYAFNYIECLKAWSFLRLIVFFDDFSVFFEYRDLFSVLENIV